MYTRKMTNHILTKKTRLGFKKDEIEKLSDQDTIQFKIYNEGTSTDPRKIDIEIQIPLSIVRHRFDLDNSKSWKEYGTHSSPRFPQWAKEYIIAGEINAKTEKNTEKCNRKKTTTKPKTITIKRSDKKGPSQRENISQKRGQAKKEKSENEFKGSLYDYLVHLTQFQTIPKNLVQSQTILNNLVPSEKNVTLFARTGLQEEWSTCGNIYTVLEDKKLFTTDNEATVSAYEYFRNTVPDQNCELFNLLQLGHIVTGTIKGPDDKNQVISNRIKLNLTKSATSFPTYQKPYKFLKYSHLTDAKKNYPEHYSKRNLLIAATLRTISPMNIFLTHTPNGNSTYTHSHIINGTRPEMGDIGEDDTYRKYFIAAMAEHVNKIENGKKCFNKFLELSGSESLIEYVKNSQKYLDESKKQTIIITDASGLK